MPPASAIGKLTAVRGSSLVRVLVLSFFSTRAIALRRSRIQVCGSVCEQVQPIRACAFSHQNQCQQLRFVCQARVSKV